MSWTRFDIHTNTRNCAIDITPQLRALVEKNAIGDGLAHIYIPHTTAAVAVNEGADPDVMRDILAFLSDRIPFNGDYRHFEGNSDAHIKSILLGANLSVPIIGNSLALGTWQKVYFCEFDGPRERHFLASVSHG